MINSPNRRSVRRSARRPAGDGRKTLGPATYRPGRARLRSSGPVGRRGDEGFVLLETLVSIVLIMVVMAAFTVFFVNSVAYTSLQRATQTATTVANSTVESLRALPASDLVTGRDAASVAAQLAAAPTTVTSTLSMMTAAVDPLALAGAGATAVVPTAAVRQTVNNVVYSKSVYLGSCVVRSSVLLDSTCSTHTLDQGPQYLRAVVAVTWSGSRCPATGCTYLTATLLSAVDDPLFSRGQPIAPELSNPGAQTSAVGDVVSLTPTVAGVPTFRVALTSGTLPAGLALNGASGAITGSPVAVTASTPLTLTLTDGFGRTTSVSFSWTVVPALTTATPAAQASIINTAVPAVALSASGGTAPYTWTDPTATLPPGLTLGGADAPAISGVVTTIGTFPVTLTVTDAAGRTATVAFTWTVDYPPFSAANPGAQTSTLGVAKTVNLSVSGGSGSFAWTGGSTLPAGVTVSTAGVISGAATTAGVRSVSLVATDTVTGIQRTVAFSWTVYAKPTVTAPTARESTFGAAVSFQLTTTCPNAPCSYALVNGPSTLGVSSTGLVTGTITSSAQTFSTVRVTVTDSVGATATTANFVWVVFNVVPTAPQSVRSENGDGAVTIVWTAPANGAVVDTYRVTSSTGATCTTTGALSCVLSGLTNGVPGSVTVTATNNAGTGPASAVVFAIPYPALLSSANGLSLWLDGADPSALIAGTACGSTAATTTVGCWKDKSGAGQNFTQATSVDRPAVGSWNGLPAPNFADTTDVLTSVTATGVYQTVFVAANVTATGTLTAYNYLFGTAAADTSNVRVGTSVNRDAPATVDWAYTAAGTGGQFTWTNGSVVSKVTSFPAPVITTDQAESAKSISASVSNSFSGRGVVGQVGDVISFNRALSADERRTVEEYLNRKWGVAIAPRAPSGVTGTAGGNSRSTVTWAAPSYDGGSAVTGYTVTSAPGNRTCTTTGTSCLVTGLSNNVSYTFTVTANNAAGTSVASAPSPAART